MIKYIEYDAIDETGQHIIPVNNLYHLNKTASGTYSPEIMKVILNMKRKPDRYYVVINALGSHEIWGSNRNGDGFPKSGLEHKSLRTDMGTINDYGYKTFEYYAVLFKHHVNKDPKKGFGEVVFAHWNPMTQRVELIVGINTESGKDIINALEKGNNVSVSMGCKVKHDRCSICDNKAKTRAQYCKHLKSHMNEIISREAATLWSKELGRIILPGAQVFAYNDYPRFFDISKVHVGADRTSYILGKAASAHVTSSVDIAEAYGVTDEQIDKLSMVGKKGEIDKEIGGALGPTDIDGSVSKIEKATVFRKALDEKVNNSIAAEPILPKETLNSMAALPLETIFSTMLGMGVYPKPAEVQRIIIIKAGRGDIADELDKNNEIFDYQDADGPCCNLDISNKNFSDTLGKALLPFLEKRSYFPLYLKSRMQDSFTKTAYYSSTEPGKDYWLQEGSGTEPMMERSRISPAMKAIGGLAAIYAGLKLKSMGYGPKQLADIFINKPWLRNMIGGGVMWKIFNKVNESNADDSILRPASDYSEVLQDTNFSGHIKSSSLDEVEEALILPSAYIFNASNQPSFTVRTKQLFPGAGTPFSKTASSSGAVVGTNTLLTETAIETINNRISKMLPKVR